MKKQKLYKEIDFEITPQVLSEILDYDPYTGLLTWKEREVKWFRDTDGRSAEHACTQWNQRYAGKPALITDSGYGYKQGRILDKGFQAHRVVWALHYGKWPEKQIDHIDRNRSNNSISNLREASNAQNGKNRTRNPRNKSGYNGIHQIKNGKFVAQAGLNGEVVYLGCFATLEEAILARAKFNEENGFSPTHGELASNLERT